MTICTELVFMLVHTAYYCVSIVLNHFIFLQLFSSISHPTKHGLPFFNLSQDVKAHVEYQENMTENQVKLE